MEKGNAGCVIIEKIVSAQSLFERLQLPVENVSRVDLRRRFKELAIRVHPDKCDDKNAKLAFQLVADAFEILSDVHGQSAEIRRALSVKCTEQPSSAKPHNTSWSDVSWIDFEKSFAERERLEETLRERFIASQSDRFIARQLQRDVKQAERTVMNLDEVHDIEPHYLWPEGFRPEEDAEDNTRSVKRRKREDEEQRLSDLLCYLRQKHHYCLYCGCAFCNRVDMESNCPGLLESDH